MHTLNLPTVADKHNIYEKLLHVRANIRGAAGPNDLPVGDMMTALDAAGRAWDAANNKIWEAKLGLSSITDGKTITILPQPSRD